eukprot:TRINITY_DN27463_c0_g1_i1.p1 TRINITY_DN27463_c0_g1~~TRINITY_DN27463_c0_g1_i1.p1  ORF type:complete len:607 (-),score=104.96 TRINITY_DN27463_c0_g1_i1:354-2174(-)
MIVTEVAWVIRKRRADVDPDTRSTATTDPSLLSEETTTSSTTVISPSRLDGTLPLVLTDSWMDLVLERADLAAEASTSKYALFEEALCLLRVRVPTSAVPEPSPDSVTATMSAEELQTMYAECKQTCEALKSQLASALARQDKCQEDLREAKEALVRGAMMQARASEQLLADASAARSEAQRVEVELAAARVQLQALREELIRSKEEKSNRDRASHKAQEQHLTLIRALQDAQERILILESQTQHEADPAPPTSSSSGRSPPEAASNGADGSTQPSISNEAFLTANRQAVERLERQVEQLRSEVQYMHERDQQQQKELWRVKLQLNDRDALLEELRHYAEVPSIVREGSASTSTNISISGYSHRSSDGNASSVPSTPGRPPPVIPLAEHPINHSSALNDRPSRFHPTTTSFVPVRFVAESCAVPVYGLSATSSSTPATNPSPPESSRPSRPDAAATPAAATEEGRTKHTAPVTASSYTHSNHSIPCSARGVPGEATGSNSRTTPTRPAARVGPRPSASASCRSVSHPVAISSHLSLLDVKAREREKWEKKAQEEVVKHRERQERERQFIKRQTSERVLKVGQACVHGKPATQTQNSGHTEHTVYEI